MNHIQVKLKSGLILCLPFVCSCNREPARPNILFIMSDDRAEAAISAYGSPISKLAPTPNIDRIAHEGAIFNANYCCNSLSGPSRAAIMTGLHSHANGFMRNGNTFDGSQETLQKILGRNGWQTALIGKWHLNGKPEGFDYWTILNDQGEYYNPDFISENDTVRIDGYVTDIITEKCKKWIGERDKDRPFFLMMHHKACHRNWWPAERHYGKYDNVEFPLPETFSHEAIEGAEAYDYRIITPKLSTTGTGNNGHIVQIKFSPVQHPGQNTFDPNYDVMYAQGLQDVDTEKCTDRCLC